MINASRTHFPQQQNDHRSYTINEQIKPRFVLQEEGELKVNLKDIIKSINTLKQSV